MAGLLWRTFATVATARPGHPAIVQGDRVVSFRELKAMAEARALALAQGGLRQGSRCLIWSPNSPELAAALLACWRLGAVVVLISDEAPTSHLAHAARVVEPSLLLVHEAGESAAVGAVEVPVVVLARDPVLPAGSLPEATSHDLEPASVFFTSGSTGLPKGVVQSHANLATGCAMVGSFLGLSAEDRILCPIPWSFDYGYGQFLSTVLKGVTQVLPEARNGFSICEALARHRPTVFAGLPSIFGLLLRGVSPLRETDRSSLRLITNTGGKIAPAIFQDILDVFGPCEISLNYGLTETYRSAGLPFHLAREKPDSVGFAYPGVGLAVVREDGTEAGPGEVGEIVHRGAGVCLGYWGNPDASAQLLRPDPLWRHAGVPAPRVVFTGDLGWKDDEGLLYVKGRRDRQIKSMGVRVSPDEIETLIRATGLVHDVAVVGIPNEIAGELVAAAVILRPGSDNPLPALKAYAAKAMSPHMRPREYRIVEAFPLTPNGKPDLARLRTLMAAGTA